MTEKVSWAEVLMSMPEEDRLQCLADEMYYGEVRVEKTEDGYRRLDPLEGVETPDDKGLGHLDLADHQNTLPANAPVARIRDLSEGRDV